MTKVDELMRLADEYALAKYRFAHVPSAVAEARAALEAALKPGVVGGPPEELKKFFHQIIHGDFLAENPEDLSMAIAARASFYALFNAPRHKHLWRNHDHH